MPTIDEVWLRWEYARAKARYEASTYAEAFPSFLHWLLLEAVK